MIGQQYLQHILFIIISNIFMTTQKAKYINRKKNNSPSKLESSRAIHLIHILITSRERKKKIQIIIQLQITKMNLERYRQKQRPNKIRQNNSQDDVSITVSW